MDQGWQGQRAIVCGGGGLGGIAWEVGYLAGLDATGIDLSRAELFVGTSAGATVAIQVAAGTPLRTMLEQQVDPARQSPERFAPFDREALREMLLARQAVGDPIRAARALGAQALAARTIDEATRLRVVEQRVRIRDWPAVRVLITAVDAETGELRLFERSSGVDVTRAVAASSALPGVWPPTSIEGRRYLDGGVRTMENADVARGYARVLVLQPLPVDGVDTLSRELEALRAAGGRAHVARPDDEVTRAMGPNPLDPAIRASTALAAYAQGRREVGEVGAFWGASTARGTRALAGSG